MKDNDITSSTVKRGPKPVGEHSMSAAERKRLSRARKAAEGRAEFMVSIAGETLAFVDQFAKHNGVTRSEVVQEFLDMAIAKIRGTVVRADQMLADGASMDDVQNVIREAFSVPEPRTEEPNKESVPTK